MIQAVRAIADAFANLFGWRQSAVEGQATSEVIDDKQDLEKACNYAEGAIELAEQEAVFNKEKNRIKFKYLVRKFRKYK